MGNVGLIMAQNHASVYLGIHSNNFFFNVFSMPEDNQQITITLFNFPESFFWDKWAIVAQL